MNSTSRLMVVLPQHVKDTYKIVEAINSLMADMVVSDIHLQSTIEIFCEGRPAGIRLVDDGMGEATYNVEFYNPEGSITNEFNLDAKP